MTSQETEPATEPAPSPEAGSRTVRLRAVAPVVVGLAVAAGGLGALGGWLWYRWWGPPNTGVIYDTASWGPRWLDLGDDGLAHQFDGPAQYAVVALGFGTVLGLLAFAVGRRQPVAALAGLVIGSPVAAYVAYAVGMALSPPDPQQYATKANVGKEYLAAIEVSGWTPFLCWPLAALGSFCLAIFVLSFFGTLQEAQAEQKQAGNWLEPAARSDRSGPTPPP